MKNYYYLAILCLFILGCNNNMDDSRNVSNVSSIINQSVNQTNFTDLVNNPSTWKVMVDCNVAKTIITDLSENMSNYPKNFTIFYSRYGGFSGQGFSTTWSINFQDAKLVSFYGTESSRTGNPMTDERNIRQCDFSFTDCNITCSCSQWTLKGNKKDYLGDYNCNISMYYTREYNNIVSTQFRSMKELKTNKCYSPHTDPINDCKYINSSIGKLYTGFSLENGGPFNENMQITYN